MCAAGCLAVINLTRHVIACDIGAMLLRMLLQPRLPRQLSLQGTLPACLPLLLVKL